MAKTLKNAERLEKLIKTDLRRNLFAKVIYIRTANNVVVLR